MNRKLRSVLLVGTVVLGISAMIPLEANAQLFRGRGGLRNGCQPVCCNTYNQASYHGHGGMAYGSASHANQQPSDCCMGTSTAGMYSSGMNYSDSQYQQDSFDSQGNRIEAGTHWNNQQRFDSQGNRIYTGTQWNNQQRFDSQGNRIEAGVHLNNQQRFDSQGNLIKADIQLNNQQRFDAQGNLIKADIQSNQDGTQIDIKTNQPGVPGSTDAGVDTLVPRDR